MVWMGPEVYEQFAEYMLSDLAERRTLRGAKLVRGRRRRERISGEQRGVCLRGDHIEYAPGVRFRDSDCSFRLALAVRAYEEASRLRCGKPSNSEACVKVAQMIIASPCKRLRERFQNGSRGRKPAAIGNGKVEPRSQKPTKQSILESEQHDPRLDELNDLIARAPKRAAKRRPVLPPEVSRLAKIVRSQVAQFRRMHSDYDQLLRRGWGPFGMNSSATRNGATRRK